jgi:tetratricopeptide (TPR) repeat protein
MTWTDDRKAAAFVNMKDPTVMKFSKNVAGAIKGKASKSINSNLLTAMAMHEAINLYGMNYVIDPSTPYKELSKKKAEIDYLQFPKQSLEYKAGDCDDLSILYCALLEAIGIETAFITVPGHIYAAISVDMTPLELRKNFLRPEDFIVFDNKIWLPVEVTVRKESFLRAWEVGAQLWREYHPKDQARLFPLHEAWQTYEPVGFSGDPASIEMPDEKRLLRVYLDEVREFVQREISPRVSRLEQQIRASGGNSRYINKLGVLYARYGLNDKAKVEFNRVLQKQGYGPTLINMGNLSYMDRDYNEALEYYTKAIDVNPDSVTALVCLARTHHAIENYGSARRYYEQLKAKSPEMASRFAYLELKGEKSDRAAEIGKSRDILLWEEE